MKNSKVHIFLLLLPVLILAAGIGYYYHYPESGKWGFQCPSTAFFKIYCPGCGSQRALHALLHLDLNASFRYNPLLIPSLLLIIGMGWNYLSSILIYGRFRIVLLHRQGFLYIVFVMLILYMIVRNLPWSFFDALRPPP